MLHCFGSNSAKFSPTQDSTTKLSEIAHCDRLSLLERTLTIKPELQASISISAMPAASCLSYNLSKIRNSSYIRMSIIVVFVQAGGILSRPPSKQSLYMREVAKSSRWPF